jgi:hypothetical protein
LAHCPGITDEDAHVRWRAADRCPTVRRAREKNREKWSSPCTVPLDPAPRALLPGRWNLGPRARGAPIVSQSRPQPRASPDQRETSGLRRWIQGQNTADQSRTPQKNTMPQHCSLSLTKAFETPWGVRLAVQRTNSGNRPRCQASGNVLRRIHVPATSPGRLPCQSPNTSLNTDKRGCAKQTMQQIYVQRDSIGTRSSAQAAGLARQPVKQRGRRHGQSRN